MHTFICQFEPTIKALKVIGSSQNLQNLQITLSYTLSLIPLKPSFERLKRLDIRLPPSGPCTKEFFRCLSCCINLGLLTICTLTDRYPLSQDLYMEAATFPKLTSLEVTNYTLIEQLRAPALRSLSMTTEIKGMNLVPTQKYLIFDDFDLSSITYLFIRGPHFNIDGTSGVHVSGSVGTISYPVTWDLFDRNLDLRGNLPSSPSVPIQFDIYARTYYTSLSSNSPFFSKVLPKLHNIKKLFISLFNWPRNPTREIPTTLDHCRVLRVLLEEVLGNLRSASLQGIVFMNMPFEWSLLLVIFQVINNYSKSLAWSLDWIYFLFSTPPECKIEISDYFGKELARSLRRRREAGQKPLRTFVMFKGGSTYDLSGKDWFTEAVTLGVEFGDNRQF